MAEIRPFAAWRPKPELAAKICELPYDVMSTEEARAIAAGNPLSFLHVSKPEIDLATDINPYDPIVYAKGRENFERLIQAGSLAMDPLPGFYLYRQIMGNHSQAGLVAAASCADYGRQVIKKHELTRVDKEDDRYRHIEILNAQTGPAFLTYRARPVLDGLFSALAKGRPEIDFVAPDGIRHSSWVISQPEQMRFIQREMEQMPCLYIADGHHRSAAAFRLYQARQGAGNSGYFLSVLFPHNQLQILPYNRVLRDTNGHSQPQLWEKLSAIFVVEPGGRPNPINKHELSFYVAGQWHGLKFKDELLSGADPINQLDVSLLQNKVLAPVFGIEDPRTSKRVNFVGGIRGAEELKKLVDSGEYACAFSLYPTGIEDLMSIADASGIMPPKSTWFEPKLRDGMFCHQL